MPTERPSSDFDVTIVGGGLAGKAASIHLSKFGFKVVCIEPSESVRQAVGESLDWSAPDLLNSLGLPMQQLVEAGIATWKRHVTLKLRDGGGEHYIPSEWLGEKPFNVELRTMHVDRLRLDQELQDIARGQGAEVVHDKVVKIERNGDRIPHFEVPGDKERGQDHRREIVRIFGEQRCHNETEFAKHRS